MIVRGVALPGRAGAWRLERATMLAVLSYHSWEVGTDALRADVRHLRASGWRIVTAMEALAYIQRRGDPSARLVLISTDDGHVEDEEWADVLTELDCPAVTFVCSALVPPERIAFYRRLASSEHFAVEDHGSHHEQHISSSRILGYVPERTAARARTGVVLAPGEPVLITTSTVATRRFDPDPAAIEFLTSLAASASCAEIRGARWREAAESGLLRRKLAVRRFGHLYLRGRFETRTQFESRVGEYLEGSRSLFERTFGRPPRLYAYAWWAGHSTGDRMLRHLGYKGSFHGTGALQRPDGRAFGVPRIPVGPTTGRPMPLDHLPARPIFTPPRLESLRAVGKRLLGIG